MENILPISQTQETEDSTTLPTQNESVVSFDTLRKKYKKVSWSPSPEQELYLDIWLTEGSEKAARRKLNLRPQQVNAWRGEPGSGFQAWVESQIKERAHNAIIMGLVASVSEVENDTFSDPSDRDKAIKSMMAATKYLDGKKKEEGTVKDLRDLSRKTNL